MRIFCLIVYVPSHEFRYVLGLRSYDFGKPDRYGTYRVRRRQLPEEMRRGVLQGWAKQILLCNRVSYRKLDRSTRGSSYTLNPSTYVEFLSHCRNTLAVFVPITHAGVHLRSKKHGEPASTLHARLAAFLLLRPVTVAQFRLKRSACGSTTCALQNTTRRMSCW